MNKPTIDGRIEALRKRIDGIAGYDSDPLGQEAIEALAIIDELLDIGAAKETAHERLKERECFGDADACACALHYEENTRR